MALVDVRKSWSSRRGQGVADFSAPSRTTSKTDTQLHPRVRVNAQT